MQTEIFTIIYWIVAIISFLLYLRGDKYKTLAGFGIFSVLYYSQNLFFGSAEAFHGLNAGVQPHWSIYFFYSLCLIFLTFAAAIENRRGCLKLMMSSNNSKKIDRLKTLYFYQFFAFLFLMIYGIYKSGVDITNKQEFLDSKNIFFLLSMMTAYPLCVLSMISGSFEKSHLALVSFFLIVTFVLGYRGVIAELFFVVLVTSYYAGRDLFFTKKNFFFVFAFVGFLVLAPAKYFMSMLYFYIVNGYFGEFDFDQMLISMKNGNEASATLGIVDIIVKSNVELPDFYFVHSIFQHIPFIREIIPIERYSFNNFFQNKLFGDWDFGVGSSAVANMYIAGNVVGLLFLVFFIFFLVTWRTEKFYFSLMGLCVIPGYIFFLHRSDWDQVLFSLSIFFYTSIIPFGFYSLTSGVKFICPNLTFLKKLT